MRVIDADGHVHEDNEGILQHAPAGYREHGFRHTVASLTPPLDHFHAQPMQVRGSDYGRVGVDGWLDFLRETGIERSVLYPTYGLAYGKITDIEWSVAYARAYNDWLAETYLQRSPRFEGMALIPMRDPQAAAAELRRAVGELGMVGTMLPSRGLANNLGSRINRPVYEAADELGCAIAIHGGSHDGMGMDDLNVYAPVQGLGHPFGLTVAFAGMVANGVFEDFPNVRVAFLEGGISWVLMVMERFDHAFSTHIPVETPSSTLRVLRDKRFPEYMAELIRSGRVYLGCEGSESYMRHVVAEVGERPFMFSSDFPHEVTVESCKEEIEEVQARNDVGDEVKNGVLWRNAQDFYRFRTE